MKPGIYKHFRDGRYYLVLFTGVFEYATAKQDDDLAVVIDHDDNGEYETYVALRSVHERIRGSNYGGLNAACIARAHGPLDAGDDVVVYVPLYTKPGRRISVRSVAEFQEEVDVPLQECGCDGGTWRDPGSGRNHTCDTCNGTGIKALPHRTPRFRYVGDVIPEAT